eukprot:TRINITY_DN8646_c0_g1_i1.p1 TRINITY_DN8646_c0_g1~~TRINITY_DN8646_c0_g1_i1.p1  ORF type:complete len:157 (+),score=37.00 TRINITY_DN8646_c0_g1_i1:427-897(+)
MPPKGVWTPALNLATLLKTIQLLMGSPNPDDGLVLEITELFTRDRAQFDAKAREWTQKYAVGDADNGNKPSSLAIGSRTGTDSTKSTTDSEKRKATTDADRGADKKARKSTAAKSTDDVNAVEEEEKVVERVTTAFDDDDSGAAVSYTHLTLPTIA